MVSSCVILLLNIEDVFITMDTFVLGFWCMCVGHLLVWSVLLVVVVLLCMFVGWEVGGMCITACTWRSETNSGICSSFRLGKCLTG